jgi:hypothetical protein
MRRIAIACIAILTAISSGTAAESPNLPKPVNVNGKIQRWTTTNTVIVTVTVKEMVDVLVGTSSVTTSTPRGGLGAVGIGPPPGFDESTSFQHTYKKQLQDVTRKVTVTGVPAGYAKAGHNVALICYKLPVTAVGMHASYVFCGPPPHVVAP